MTRWLILTAVLFCSCHKPDCPSPDGGDGGLTPYVNPCVLVDECGDPVLDKDGHQIPLADGAPCKLGDAGTGTCQAHECVLDGSQP